MWQSPTLVLNDSGKPMTELNTWVYLFAKTWEALEPDPEDLDMHGFHVFGAAVAEKHGEEDPTVVAKRLFPEAGEYHDDLYPADAAEDASEASEQSEPPAPLAFGLVHPDVPF